MIADLTGQVAFVTGAASGIGRATVQCLVEQGAVVEATDIDQANLDALAAEAGPDRVRTSRLDVSSADDVRAAVDEAVFRHGRVDVLVCSARADVRHIVVTHFDSDHIGGLADFPHASVHVTAAEALGSIVSPSWRERIRYRRAQWAHAPQIVEHTPDGEQWRGFAAAKQLDDVAPGIVLVSSLPGRTRVHAGDAFYHPGTIDGRSKVPLALRALETIAALDLRRVRNNHARLAELHRRAEPDLQIVNAHDPTLYEKTRTHA